MLTSGDVVDLDLGSPAGREAGFRHPAIVVTAQRVLDAEPSVVQVVPLTSTLRGFSSEVEIDAGENEGVDMLHYNMVKSLTYLGRWAGGAMEFTGEGYRHYGTVAIVQGANGGPIYGYAHLEAEPGAGSARR